MYSWGDDTATWKKPGAYDYGAANKAYISSLKKKADEEGPRSYSTKSKPKLELVDPKGRVITTNSANPVLVAVDGTGSMQAWPAEIFDRLPLMYQTLSKYRDDVSLSFSVIGDSVSDNWPVQISDFGKGVTLDKFLKALKPEGGGGPGIRENYELWGYYVNERVTTPKASKASSPLMIIMGDEKFYDTIRPELAEKYLGFKPQTTLDSREMWKELDKKFDIYLLRKSYPGRDEEIIKQWQAVLGPQKIVPIYEAERAVDVALGIIAQTWGKFSDFSKNLSARQDEDKIALVAESLRAADIVDAKSLKLLGAGKSKPLLEG